MLGLAASFGAALAIATALPIALAPAALASGHSGNANGCTGYYWNTAYAGECQNVTKTAQFNLVHNCSFTGLGTGRWVSISRGATISSYDSGTCSFGVISAYVTTK